MRSRREKEAEEQPGEGAHRKLIMLEGLDEEQVSLYDFATSKREGGRGRRRGK